MSDEFNKISDPVTNTPGVHPLGTGVGAMVGGLPPTDEENSKVIDVLNTLLESCRDGEYGFSSSADHAQAPDIRALLARHAGECAGAAAQLEREITTRGGKPDSGGTAAGALHRGWVSVRSALTSKDDRAVLSDCESAEDKAVACYRAALKETLPSDLRALIEQQSIGAKRNHDEIKALRDAMPA